MNSWCRPMTWCGPITIHEVAYMPVMGRLQRPAMVQTQMVYPMGEYSIEHGTLKQKAYTRTDTDTYKRKWWEAKL